MSTTTRTDGLPALNEPQITPGTPIRERVRLLRRGIEAAIGETFDSALSGLLDQVLGLEDALAPDLNEPERIAPNRATTCPWCGAPRRCCQQSSAAGDPADLHGAPA